MVRSKEDTVLPREKFNEKDLTKTLREYNISGTIKALTEGETKEEYYISGLGMSDADTLRNRAATAEQERRQRLLSKEIRTPETETSLQVNEETGAYT